jgi:acyl carrier protein
MATFDIFAHRLETAAADQIGKGGPMSQEDALKWITELFEEPPGSLTPETALSSVPKWDSLGVLTLMAALDEKFNLLITADNTIAMRKIGDILDLLQKNGKLT